MKKMLLLTLCLSSLIFAQNVPLNQLAASHGSEGGGGGDYEIAEKLVVYEKLEMNLKKISSLLKNSSNYKDKFSDTEVNLFTKTIDEIIQNKRISILRDGDQDNHDTNKKVIIDKYGVERTALNFKEPKSLVYDFEKIVKIIDNEDALTLLNAHEIASINGLEENDPSKPDVYVGYKFSRRFFDLSKYNHNIISDVNYSIYNRHIFNTISNNETWKRKINKEELQENKVWMCSFIPAFGFESHDFMQNLPLNKFVPTYQLKSVGEGWYENTGLRHVRALVDIGLKNKSNLASQNQKQTFTDYLTVKNGDLYAESTIHSDFVMSYLSFSQAQKFLEKAVFSLNDPTRIVIGHHYCPGSAVLNKSKTIEDLSLLEGDGQYVKHLLRPKKTPIVHRIGNRCEIEILTSKIDEMSDYHDTYGGVRDTRSEKSRFHNYNLLVNSVLQGSVEELVEQELHKYHAESYSGSSDKYWYDFYFLKNTIRTEKRRWKRDHSGTTFVTVGEGLLAEINAYSHSGIQKEQSIESTEYLSNGLTEKESLFLAKMKVLLRQGVCE